MAYKVPYSIKFEDMETKEELQRIGAEAVRTALKTMTKQDMTNIDLLSVEVELNALYSLMEDIRIEMDSDRQKKEKLESKLESDKQQYNEVRREYESKLMQKKKLEQRQGQKITELQHVNQRIADKRESKNFELDVWEEIEKCKYCKPKEVIEYVTSHDPIQCERGIVEILESLL